MRRCEKCGVEFTGDLDSCPLCQASLTGEAVPSVFPRNEVKKSGTMALRILAFATGAGVLVMAFLGHLLALPADVVLVVCLAILANYVLVRHILSSAPDILRLVGRYFLLLLGLAMVWFFVSGNQAITTFVIPSICLVALVFDAVVVCVFRGTFVSGYAKYLLLDVVFGLVPMVFALLGLVTWDIPSYASALVSAVLALALFVFMRERFSAEIRKLFTA